MKNTYIDQYGIDSLKQLFIAIDYNLSYYVTSNENLVRDRNELQPMLNIKIITVKELNELYKVRIK